MYRLRQNNERVEDARSEHQIVKEAFEEPRIQHSEKNVVYVLTTVNINEEVYIEEVEVQLFGNRSNNGVNSDRNSIATRDQVYTL